MPKQDVDSFLSELSKDYKIFIFTTRNSLDVAEWLIKYDLRKYISNITNVKAPAFAYIDDRAIKFNGDYSKTLEKLKKFKPYWNIV
ncbi:MAG: NIF family HAD-type phosphatase [Candidatus Gastranaerophilales bacterium]|nr:NIF family HAD-type phosphatase [Candidatus Gastranaerophilales bacterium]